MSDRGSVIIPVKGSSSGGGECLNAAGPGDEPAGEGECAKERERKTAERADEVARLQEQLAREEAREKELEHEGEQRAVELGELKEKLASEIERERELEVQHANVEQMMREMEAHLRGDLERERFRCAQATALEAGVRRLRARSTTAPTSLTPASLDQVSVWMSAEFKASCT